MSAEEVTLKLYVIFKLSKYYNRQVVKDSEWRHQSRIHVKIQNLALTFDWIFQTNETNQDNKLTAKYNENMAVFQCDHAIEVMRWRNILDTICI